MRFFLLLVAVVVTAFVIEFAPQALPLVLIGDALFMAVVLNTGPLKAGVW
jgi:hypothetical protein